MSIRRVVPPRRGVVAALALSCSLLAVSAAPAVAAPSHHRHYGHHHHPVGPDRAYARLGARRFDLQAHRGGIGLTSESTIASFTKAIRLGVTSLEMDVQITKDRQAVITHDRKTTADKCQDTGPATPGDPAFPYVGKYVKDLTLAQVETLDCGSKRLPAFPDQELAPGARMPTLRAVLQLVRRTGFDGRLNVETKVEAAAPQETAPREQFVQITARELRWAGMLRRTTIESFDFGSLRRMAQVEPRLPLVALTDSTFPQVGQPGASPWLGGYDVDDFGGSIARVAKAVGASALSPVHGDPQDAGVETPGYKPYTTKALVDETHRLGMKVIPWTVDDEATMRALIGYGVDGLITDYPDRLRAVLASEGWRLPAADPRAAAR